MPWKESGMLVSSFLASYVLSTGEDSETLVTAYTTSRRAPLLHFYPILLELSFLRTTLPSMWIFPSEHARLFSLPQLENEPNGVFDAGDGGDLIEVNARDIARRCLELIGKEMGLF